MEVLQGALLISLDSIGQAAMAKALPLLNSPYK